ncbi:dehydrogenase [Virgisporangium aliadipatigenens]|uniref:alcohol dehydrogenase (NADP(+)) n=1 Tax=Virgisporangium aliadipatigenens TaxID=741659 RepID=A0A8J3YFH8_9ACTN|nr:NAD(P)-dependent alcohol dehydrogenase [Virgisporangium aliadipatigenens]GIJ43312.1 dehydrogenase [Virgisporangium aliadipatigenens]
MPVAVNAYSVEYAGAPLTPITLERRDPGRTELLVDVAYVGVCHSDVHFARDDWGISRFPMVPGHEITGVVAAVGPDVTRYVPGDRVGIGNLLDSCRTCANCRAGRQQYCLGGAVSTYNSIDRTGTPTAGGYSEKILVEQDYALRVPDALDLAAAAPLLCAGVTMYSALRHWNAGPGTRVAIAGLGGLGHLGVRFAAAMGAEVSVLSRTAAKAADSARFGAAHHYTTAEAAGLGGRFDLIVSTLSTAADTAPFLALLATDGTLVMAGAPAAPLTAPVGLLIGGRRSVAGTSIGGIGETQEMLDFCVAHGIAAEIEVIGADALDTAFGRLDAADVRYRLVLDATTLRT